MEYQANEIRILKTEEFLMLLAASGIESWHGIDLSDEKDRLEEERAFNSSLASLYQKNAVDWVEGRAGISEDYKQIFTAIRDAGLCVLVRTGDKPELLRSCYLCRGDVVVVNHRRSAEDEVEICMMSKEDWIEELMAELELPIYTEEVSEDDSEQIEVLCELELRAVPEGRQLETVKICETGLGACIVVEAGARSKKEAYSEERVREVLGLWCGGNL